MIINRYIYREIFQRLIWIAALLFLIFSTFKYVDYLSDAASGKIPAGYILKLLCLRMLAMQTEVLPLVLFLAVILTYSRLEQDNELTALATAGIGTVHQLHIVVRFTLVFCLLVAFISFHASPWAKSNIWKLKEQAWQESMITGIAAGQFKELNNSNSVLYVEKYSENKNTMQNIFLQIRQNDKNSVIRSDKARFDTANESGNRFIIFENGRRYLGTPGTVVYQITDYEKLGVLIETKDTEFSSSNPEVLPTSALLGSTLIIHRAELQWRISSVLACLLLGLFAVILSRLPIGKKPYTLLLIAILIYFIYSNTLGISRTLMERNLIPPYLGLWWVHLILITFAIVTYYFTVITQWKKRDRKLQILHNDQ